MGDFGVGVHSETLLCDSINRHPEERPDRAILSVSDVDAAFTVRSDVGLFGPLFGFFTAAVTAGVVLAVLAVTAVVAIVVVGIVVVGVVVLSVVIVGIVVVDAIVEIDTTEPVVEIVGVVVHKLKDSW